MLNSIIKQFENVSITSKSSTQALTEKEEETTDLLTTNLNNSRSDRDNLFNDSARPSESTTFDTVKFDSADMDAVETYSDFQRWCRIGQIFLFHTDYNKPSPTHLRVNKSGTHIFAATSQNKEPIPLKKVKKLVLANMVFDENDIKTTNAPDNKYWRKADPKLCFSIVSQQITYHLEAMTQEVRDIWIKGLNDLILRAKVPK